MSLEAEPPVMEPEQPQPPPRRSPNQKLAVAGILVIILGAGAAGTVLTLRQIAFPREHGHSHSHGHSHRARASTTETDNDDHHHGNVRKQDFGTTTIGDVKFQSVVQDGPILPGKEGAFDVVLAEGQQPPRAIRAWIGVASGEGSLKAKLEKEPENRYHSHVQAPDPLPEGSQYWLEVETANGPKAKAGFEFFTEDPAPGAH